MKPSKAIIAGAAVAGLLTGSAAVRAHADSLRFQPPATGIFAYSLPSALEIDIEHETVTLPLQEGRTTDGRRTWYIVTESSDQADATRRGVNYSNKLLNAVGTAAVQKVSSGAHGLVFPGTVDFGLTHVLVPDPTAFRLPNSPQAPPGMRSTARWCRLSPKPEAASCSTRPRWPMILAAVVASSTSTTDEER